MASLINLSFVSLIYRTPTGEPKWGEEEKVFFFPLSPTWTRGSDKKEPQHQEIRSQNSWDGRRESSENSRLRTCPRSSELACRVEEPPDSARRAQAWGPHISKSDSIKVPPQSRATLVPFLKAQILDYVHTMQFSLEWPPTILNFQDYRRLFWRSTILFISQALHLHLFSSTAVLSFCHIN